MTSRDFRREMGEIGMIRTIAAAAAFALALAAPASAQDAGRGPAQPQPRKLEVPAASAWQHAQTQMILPPRAGGLVRREISDLGDEEMDVVADYRGDDGLVATVFLFRTAIADPALWFDRAAATISLHPAHGLAGAPLPTPTPFARPGATAASGLRVAVDTPGAELRSTGLAVVPLGDHLLKIRISARSLDRAALEAALTRFLEGLRWPAPAAGERVALPIEPCPRPLSLRNARVVRSDMGNVLMDAVAGSMQAESEGPLPVYCREPGATLQYGVYRPNAARDSYLIALNDAGIALSLGQGMDLSELLGGGGGGRRVSMTLLERNSTAVLPSFNRLPPPSQAIAVAFGTRGPVISATTAPPRN